MKSNPKKGFTLIELLIVIGIITILAAAVIIAINPGEQFSQARDSTRKSHLNSLRGAMHSEYVSEMEYPEEVTDELWEVCNTNLDDPDCSGMVDLGGTDISVPVDPQAEGNGTGYEVAIIDGRVALNAIYSESEVIFLGPHIPLADLSDLEAIGSNEEHNFAEGTAVEEKTKGSMDDYYIMVSDIELETDFEPLGEEYKLILNKTNATGGTYKLEGESEGMGDFKTDSIAYDADAMDIENALWDAGVEEAYVNETEEDKYEIILYYGGELHNVITDDLEGDIELKESKPFQGTFNGNGHVIRDGEINYPDDRHIGVFGYNEGTIRNVKVEDVEVVGNRLVGGVIGKNDGIAKNIYVTDSSVEGRASSSRTGGLIGENRPDGRTQDSYARGIEVAGENQLGGLVGFSHGELKNNYVAETNIEEGSYVGGLIGVNHGEIQSNYWDVDTINQSDGIGGGDTDAEVEGKTTPEMQQKDTFVDWIFENIWEIDEGESYPYLKWE